MNWTNRVTSRHKRTLRSYDDIPNKNSMIAGTNTTINEMIFLVSNSDYLLLVYRNTVDFCTDYLYSATSLRLYLVLVGFVCLFVYCCWFFIFGAWEIP